MAVRPVAPGSVTRVPVLIPSHGLPFRPRTPFATVLIRPIFGFGNGGGCFFNGFTTLCGFGFFNPFFSSIYGPGYGYGGYGYYDPGNYYVGATEPTLPADDQYPQNSGRMDIYGGYDPNALTGPAGSETTVPAPPPTQIILKSGVAFAVNSYWVSNGELYYRPVTGGLSHVPLDQLDLAATVQVNSKNGVAFTLSENVPQN
ncbi:MAG TPA: hypothetical protein VKG84_03680 [Candidatus Acidoferrales bacterium]|nr:hypothetical protein [Candidatus Acidoferrales bacterium]